MSTGELNENKNLAMIIKAVAKIKDLDVHYFIAGRGMKEVELKDLSTELGIEDYIHILGFRSDVADLLKAADCFAFPSKREGLGLAAIEAMASGLPLLTSNAGGINDYSVDGVTGYKYDADDVGGFARGIEGLKNDPIKLFRMSKKNQVQAVYFDKEKVINIMENVYRNI